MCLHLWSLHSTEEYEHQTNEEAGNSSGVKYCAEHTVKQGDEVEYCEQGKKWKDMRLEGVHMAFLEGLLGRMRKRDLNLSGVGS